MGRAGWPNPGLPAAKGGPIPVAIALVVSVVLLGACAPDRSDAPARLSFEPVDTGGRSGFATTGDEGATEATGGVIVGEAIGGVVTVYAGPSASSGVVTRLDNPTEMGGPLVFQLVDENAAVHDRDAWVEVHLPIRPNGSTGWVRVSDLWFTRNPYRLEIDAGDHELRVYRSDVLWIETSVGIGTGDTPTPRGQFYIIELLQPPDPTGLYGPFAFGLSGFSETLRSFAGGDGVIGIHGTDEPQALGTDVSHGCVRVHNDVITEMAGTIPLGTPVVITD